MKKSLKAEKCTKLGLTSTKEEQNKESYFKRVRVEETPFSLGVTENETLIFIGNFLVTDKKFKSEKEATEYIEEKPWELILTTLYVLLKKLELPQKTEKNAENQQSEQSSMD